MYSEDDLVMISALQHYLFCPRQCALIHIEQQWTENIYTAEGQAMHERVHTVGKESRRQIKVEFDLPLRSLQLGLIGRGDIVEFHLQDDGSWQPFPVEYKRGRPKKDNCDKVQLCAQGISLEEMLAVEVPSGALYYGTKKRRVEILFTPELRQETKETANKLHQLLSAGITPPPIHDDRCENCSLFAECLPETVHKKGKVARYMQTILRL